MSVFIRQLETYFPIIPHWLASAIWYLIVSAALVAFFALFAGPVSWLERRIAGRIMSRIGPNRVGPQGIIQWLADGLKNWLKEDLIPDSADKILFRLAPYPVFLGVLLTLATLPFSSLLIGADLNVGILYIVGAWGLVVIGLLAAGWSSNNKWSLLGGMRSAAQMVSYEIPMVLSLLVAVMMAGSLSLQDIIRSQGANPIGWFIFSQPFAPIAFIIFLVAAVAEGNRTPFDIPEAESELVSGYNTEYSGMRFLFFFSQPFAPIAFIIFLVAAVAEGNRTPFDIPEAESELVSGYNTEYSGMRFLFFFFAEWGNLYVVGAIAAALFFGGWQIPASWHAWALSKWFVLPHIMEALVFQIKAWIWILLIIQLRWTVPRLRVDQLMKVSWRYLTPFAFLSLIGTGAWLVVFPDGVEAIRYALFGLAVLFVLYYVWRIVWHMRFTRSRFDFNPMI